MITNVSLLKKLNIITKTGRLNPNTGRILTSNPKVKDSIHECTSFLVGDNIAIGERIFCICNAITSQPCCATCNTPVRYSKDKRTFPKFCSVKCARCNKEVKHKTKKTMLERYGADRTSIKEKTKATCLSKFGSTSPLGNSNIIQKIKNTNINRYGHENAAKADSVKEKTKNTCLARYGTYAPSMCGSVQTKISNNHARSISGNLNDPNWLHNMHKKHTLSEIANVLNVGCSIVSSRFAEYKLPVHRHFSTSKPQAQLNDFLLSLGLKTTMNSKIPSSSQELDILIRSVNIGIEMNGVYWHSELNNKHKQYHLNKTIACADENIRLIHVLDNEWIHKNDIVKSRLCAIVGRISHKIGGRECQITYPSSRQTKDFLIDNHIQGWCASSINIGLQHSGKLVALMTFGKSRFNKYDYELLRFCNTLNTIVVGGAAKLLSAFDSMHPTASLVSFSDKRWSEGGVYKQLNFTHTHDSSPNYKYFHNSDVHKLYSRQQFQKHKLSSKLDNYDSTLSEWENMKNHKYNRIWDCGNGVWVRTPQQANKKGK